MAMDAAPVPKRRHKLQQSKKESESSVDELIESTFAPESDDVVVLQSDNVQKGSTSSKTRKEDAPALVTFDLDSKQESSSAFIENDLRVNQNLKNELKDSLEGKCTEICKVLNEIKTDVVSIHQKDSDTIPESIETPKVSKPQIFIKDSYYIQQRNRFIKSNHPYADLLGQSDSNLWLNSRRQDLCSPLDAAIFFQRRIIAPFCSICHGLLAGVATMQLFLAYFLTDGLHNSQNFQEIFFKAYQEVSLAGPSCFAFLSSVCFVSILDRIDLFHLAKSDLRDWTSYRRIWIIGVLYFCGLLSNAICFSYDDMIWHHQSEKGLDSNPQTSAQVEVAVSNRTQNMILNSSMPTWQILNAARCVCAIFGWILLSFAQPEDLLADHLEQVKSFEMEVDAISTIDVRG